MQDRSFSDRLLSWWDEHGRKDLPWQRPRSPYRVWVSEIMLQQTQVKTAIPYFNRFMKTFPDLQSLATANADDVLALWSGLGYYARARNLLKTAQLCVAEGKVDLPETASELAMLPGIGESTANAIFSQAHNQPAVILDGNVKRVLARHAAVEGWSGKSSVHKHLWAIAQKLLPDQRGADYSQAIMDLGATVCTRSKPRCLHCPVAEDCKALQQNRVAELPAARPKIKVAEKTFTMLILKDKKNRVLLERRPPAGIWGGLWSLPANDNGENLEQRLGVSTQTLTSLPSLQHQLTHIKMTIKPLIGNKSSSASPSAKGVECSPEQQWFGIEEWPKLGLSKPVRQLLETHMNNSPKDCTQ